MSDTRETLVNLAENAMRTRGYGGFSYADIARDAGIRKASIHHHFPTKADLGLAVLDRYADQVSRQLDAIDQQSRLGGQALLGAIEMYRAATGSGQALCLCTALAGDSELVCDDMREMLARANSMVAQWIEQTLLKGRRDMSIAVSGDPAVEAVAILAQLQGAQLLARAAGDMDQFDHAVSTIAARVSRR